MKEAIKAVQSGTSKNGQRLSVIDVREFARLTGIVGYFCVVMALSHTSRLLLDALIFLGDGEYDKWLAVSDLRLGFYIRAEQRILKDKTLPPIRADDDKKWLVLGGRKISKDSLCKWVGRQRKTLIQEQNRAGITLVEVRTGGHRKGENVPTEYRLPLFALIQEVQDLLANDTTLDAQNHEDVEKHIWKAVLAVLEDERKNVQRVAKEVRFRRPRETPEKYLNLSLAYMRKWMDMCFRDAEKFEALSDEFEKQWVNAFMQHGQMLGIVPVKVNAQGQRDAERMFGHSL